MSRCDACDLLTFELESMNLAASRVNSTRIVSGLVKGVVTAQRLPMRRTAAPSYKTNSSERFI